MQLQYCSVLQSILLQYFSVLLRQNDVLPVLLRTTSTTPILLRTTKYYSSTTPYNKVVLQSTTPVLYSVLQSRTTKYYSSTTPYYSNTTPIHSILQSTSPVLLRTTKYYSSTTPYYKVLQKHPQRAFRARLPQLFKQQASKTSISCEASATFQATKLSKRAFRARLLQLFNLEASKVLRLPCKTRK